MLTKFVPFNHQVLPHADNAISIDILHPDNCPICKRGTFVSLLHTCYYLREEFKNHNYKYGVCTYFCPACKNSFIGIFAIDMNLEPATATLMNIAPNAYSGTAFSDSIETISPDFVRIYNQAEEAEARKLLDLCGLGYRKALEHLIKDYLCHVQPDNAETIKKTKLGDCITMLGDPTLRDLAATASWLGNDFAHYERRHTQFDLDDLKRFISSAGFLISHSLTALQAAQLRTHQTGQSRK